MLILLADDERLTRLGLQSMLEELYPDENTYLHARNGKEVIEILRTNEPDIAFLDVKMPYMGGLEALKVCSNMSVKTTWVIVSGYADFEYARLALSLSVFEYLLKPVDLETLHSLIDRIAAGKESDRNQKNTIFSHDIIRTFNMADQFGMEETEFLPAVSSDYILYQFYIDLFDRKLQNKVKQKLRSSLTEFCKGNSSIINDCLFFNTEGNLCLVCDAPDASRLTHFISLQSEDLPKNAFSVFWGNHKSVRGIYDISCRIKKISGLRFIRNCAEPAFIKDLEALPSLNVMLTFSRTITDLLNLSIAGNHGLYRKKLQGLSENTDLQKAFRLIDRDIFNNYLAGFFERKPEFETYMEMLDWLRSCDHEKNAIALSAGSTDLGKIENYICSNYSGDVSISKVSELFNLSPSYLSRIFHEKTGQKYIDFVIQVRMEEAKRLLRENPQISVKQAAEAVGYASVRHFSKTFQKYVGMLPSEYSVYKELP